MITGTDLRLAREAAKRGLTDIARQVPCSRGHLSRVERNERAVTPKIIWAYETVLGGKIAATPERDSGLTFDDMDRRVVLGLIASASVGGAALGPLSHLLDELPVVSLPTRVGLTEVETVEKAMDLYTVLDLRFGGGHAVEIARGSLRWSSGLLGQTMTKATRMRLFAAVGALADRIGWSYYDMGDHAAASRLFTFGLNTAAKGGDPDLRGHILLNLSTQTFDSGQRAEAIEILRMALGDDRIHYAERANLHFVAARHCGGLGDTQAVRRHLGLAGEAFAKAEPSTAALWAKRVTAEPGHFESAEGLALFAVGDDELAREKFTAALDTLGENRVRTALRCRARLAVIHLRNGDKAQGEAEARLALAAAGEIKSARVRSDLVMIRSAAQKYNRSDLARDIDHALAS